jgi:hypothetical protein
VTQTCSGMVAGSAPQAAGICGPSLSAAELLAGVWACRLCVLSLARPEPPVLRLLTVPSPLPAAVLLFSAESRPKELEPGSLLAFSEALKESDSSGCSIRKLKPDSSFLSLPVSSGGRARISESSGAATAASAGAASWDAVAAAAMAVAAVAAAGGWEMTVSLQPATEEVVAWQLVLTVTKLLCLCWAISTAAAAAPAPAGVNATAPRPSAAWLHCCCRACTCCACGSSAVLLSCCCCCCCGVLSMPGRVSEA